MKDKERKAELAVVSSRGQLVLPKEIRTYLDIHKGSVLTVFADKQGEMIVLKKIAIPTPDETFKELHKLGAKLAREFNISRKDLARAMKEVRGHA